MAGAAAHNTGQVLVAALLMKDIVVITLLPVILTFRQRNGCSGGYYKHFSHGQA